MATKRGEEQPQWATPDLSDAVSFDQDTEDYEPSSQILEVPELTDDVLTAIEAESAGRTTPDVQPQAPTQHGEPGSYVDCEICGRRVRVKRDGELSQHKCEAKSQRGNRFDHLPSPKPAPRKVREFCINVLAWGVEESSAQVLSRATGIHADEIPTDLPDAEEMIGPPLDIAWPHIPESAQEFLVMLADNSQLISCALLWAEWAKTLGTFTREARAYNRSLLEREANAASYASGEGQFGTVTPFRPTAPQ